MTAPDAKMYWNLLETLRWIGTRDERRIAAMEGSDEKRQTPLTIFPVETVLDAHALWALVKFDLTGDWEPGARQASRESLDAKQAGMMGPSQALDYLLQQVRSRRIRMKAIQCDRYRVKRVPVSPAELGALEFRITSDHGLAKVGLWSRSRNTLMWRSPQFLRADIIRVWPPRKKNSAAISRVILQHLQTIMNPAAPLTRADAQRRCLAEVPDAYPEAFNKAWAILDPSCKRGRGQRDRRTL